MNVHEASVRIAVDMAEEGLVSRDEALLMVDANSIASLLAMVGAADFQALGDPSALWEKLTQAIDTLPEEQIIVG